MKMIIHFHHGYTHVYIISLSKSCSYDSSLSKHRHKHFKSLLIRESHINTKLRIHKPLQPFRFRDVCERSHIFGIKSDEILVLFDAGRRYGFSEDGGTACH